MKSAKRKSNFEKKIKLSIIVVVCKICFKIDLKNVMNHD